MKQISVNKNCSGCGLCIMNCNYLQENAEGNAEAVPGRAIKDKDMENLKKVIAECPENALSIVEVGSTNKKGSAGIAEVIAALKKKCNEFTVKRIGNSDVKLNIKDYDISVPMSLKERRRDYTSESSAKSAARSELNRLCYSQTAYRPMIRKVFVEYKVNILKPYYNCTDTEDSIYYSYNEQIRKLLSDAYAEIDEISGGNNRVPESWKNCSIYFKDSDFAMERIKYFDDLSTNSGIISDFKSRGEYTSLDWYVDRLDYDYDERYVGEGLFGREKYKEVWYFSGFDEAAKEFIDDLKSSIDSMSSEIEDEAVDRVNCALENFEKNVKKELSAKISELENYIK